MDKVWDYWTKPEHITKWNTATDDWHTPSATNDLRTGGTFTSRMESVDGTQGFDFTGTYSEVVPHEKIAYAMEDGRHVVVLFVERDGGVVLTETFDPESENPIDMQRAGWQAILDNFKKYVEHN